VRISKQLLVFDQLSQKSGLSGRDLTSVNRTRSDISEVLSGDETTSHFISNVVLILRCFVSSSFDCGVGVCVSVFNVSCRSGFDEPWLPRRNDRSVQLKQARLSISKRNCCNVDITRINQNLDSWFLIWEVGVKRNHRLERGSVVDVVGANGPRESCNCVDCILNVSPVQIVCGVSSQIFAVWPSSVDSKVEGSVSTAEILIKIIRIK